MNPKLDEAELAPARPRPRPRLGPGFSQMDWMKLAQKAQTPAAGRTVTLEEVRQHNKLGLDAWMVVRGTVYDVTKYAPYHPGGIAELARAVGDDGTALFEEVHPWVSEAMLDKFVVGRLAPAGKQPQPKQRTGILARLRHSTPPKVPLAASGGAGEQPSEPQRWHPCTVSSRRRVAGCRSCVLVRLTCEQLPPAARAALGKPGSVVKLRTRKGKLFVERPFTPLLNAPHAPCTLSDKLQLTPKPDSAVDLLVKAYRDGVLSLLLATCDMGQSLEIEVVPSAHSLAATPGGELALAMRGAAAFRKPPPTSDAEASAGAGQAPQPPRVEHLCMVAAGTGIAPMAQVVDFVATARAAGELRAPPTLSLVLASRSEADIIFCAELEALCAEGQLAKVTHVISKPREEGEAAAWGGQVGHVTEQLLAAHLREVYPGEAAAEDARQPRLRILFCGSFGFNDAVEAALARLGWPSSCTVRID